MSNSAERSVHLVLVVLEGSSAPPPGLEIPLRLEPGEPPRTLGRDPGCTVRFGEEFPTVSRVHCALEADARGAIILQHRSRTNLTFVNGHPVSGEVRLAAGDEIRLADEGPRLLVRIPMDGGDLGILDSPPQARRRGKRQGSGSDSGLRSRSRTGNPRIGGGALVAGLLLILFGGLGVRLWGGRADLPTLIEPWKPFVLALTMEGGEALSADGRTRIPIPGEAPGAISCTGFVLEGGIFVTARHCVDAVVADDPRLNALEQQGGTIDLRFRARNADGSRVIAFARSDLTMDHSGDARVEGPAGPRGERLRIRLADYADGSDWAWMALEGGTEGIAFDPNLAQALRAGTELYVLGYSYGERYRPSGNLEPYFSSTTVTLSGLESGMIQVSNPGFDRGNSGGPAFARVRGQLRAVGLVTGGGIGDDGTPHRIGILTPLLGF
jgi:hypothetical protein